MILSATNKFPTLHCIFKYSHNQHIKYNKDPRLCLMSQGNFKTNVQSQNVYTRCSGQMAN